MKRGTPDHIKTKRLARALNLPLYAAAGLLEMLWHRTAALAPAGDIGRLADVEIAQEVSWDRSPEELMEALVSNGWVDRCCQSHRLRVHDWPQHADQTLKRNLLSAGGNFLTCYASASSVLAADEQETSCLALPCQAKPSLAVPTDSLADRASEVLEYFSTVTGTQVKSATVRAAYVKRIEARLREKFTVEQLKACVHGALADSYYREQGYHKQPDVIYRHAARVEKLIRASQAPPGRASPQPGRRLTAAEQTMQAIEEHERITGRGGSDGRSGADGRADQVDSLPPGPA